MESAGMFADDFQQEFRSHGMRVAQVDR